MMTNIKSCNLETNNIRGYAASTSFNLKKKIMNEERAKYGEFTTLTVFYL